MLFLDKNSAYSEVIERSQCEVVEVHWIALQFYHNEPYELYQEIAESGLFCKVFDVPEEDFLEIESTDELSSLIIEHAGLGFLAKVFLRERTDFRMDWQGNMKSFGSSDDTGNLAYVYAETADDLVSKIKTMADKYTEAFFVEWKKTHEPPLSKSARKKRNRLLREAEAKAALTEENPTPLP